MYGNDAGFAVGSASGGTRAVNRIEPPPSTPVLMGLNCRIGDLKELHEAIGELERRLGPVMCPEPPSSGSGAIQAMPTRSEVTEQIERIGEGIIRATGRLKSLLGRLDI